MKIDKKVLKIEKDFMKLTKNPFKMLGSYSGLAAFIFILVSNIQLKPILWLFDFFYAVFSKFGWCANWQSGICLGFVGPLIILLVGIIFFIIGWRLHILIRRMRYNHKIKKLKNKK